MIWEVYHRQRRGNGRRGSVYNAISDQNRAEQAVGVILEMLYQGVGFTLLFADMSRFVFAYRKKRCLGGGKKGG
jgi:hypothetical protein